MSAGGPLFEKSRSIEDMQQMRLLVLLEELVRDKGIMRAARDLNVDRRTLTAGLRTGRLSRRMRGALEKALLEGGGSPAREQRERNDALAGRVEKVEGQVDDLGWETNQGLASVQGEVRELRDEQERGMRRLSQLETGSGDDQDGDMEGKGESSDATVGPPEPVNAGQRSPSRLRREFPSWLLLTRRTTTRRSWARLGAWFKNGGISRTLTPAGARAWTGCASRSGCCRWSWPCWRNTG